MTSADPGADLYWIPLGAGTRVVRFSGKVYETITSRIHDANDARCITLP